MLTIRDAAPADVPLLLSLIRALAEYERLSAHCVATEDDLREHLFGPRPFAEAILAEVDGVAAGFALYFHNFSTFVGRPGLYLEDLFVLPEFRGQGVGKALLLRFARIAHQRGCRRAEWAVLDWNKPAIDFYKGLGAVPLDDWTLFRLSGEALERLGTAAEE